MMAKAQPKTLSKASFLIAAISVMCDCDLCVRLCRNIFSLLEPWPILVISIKDCPDTHYAAV